MKRIEKTQYTVRQVPKRLDDALRLEARRQGKSLNEVAIAALSQGLGLAGTPIRYHDLDALAGSWQEDPAFDQAIAAQDQIDPGGVAVKLALDTNRYVDFCRGDALVVERLQEASLIVLPFIVLAELRAGFVCGTRARQNERTLINFLNSPRVAIFYPDEQTTHHYAALFRQLRQQGTPIPINDLWTAALVVQHDLLLYARDAHFNHLPQISRL